MELPLFPLHTVLFPGRPLPLHVFEPRYRQLLRDCLASDRRFGVVAIRSGREVGGCAELFEVGTVAEIERVEHLPDGRANIVARGRDRFRLGAMVDGAPYRRAHAEPLAEPPPSPGDLDRARVLRHELLAYLAALGAPRQALECVPADPESLVWLAASTVQVELGVLQQVLETADWSQRVEHTTRLLQREAGLVRHLGTVGSLRPAGPGGADLN